ncbi:hypothetical protein F5B18DRAFT_653571 [Nemania serpens]|nr:hypothetical protein F5B18DRAFT_653571 [Nemania serpens]
MAAETMVLHGLTPRGLSADDFDTASIRSAAPSYVSEAPSYHTLPPNEIIPAYSPPATTTATTTNASTRTPAPLRQVSSMLSPTPESQSSFAPGVGLPPIPRRSEMLSTPSLSHFNISPWSSISTGNPQVRHYQSVANRRVAAASASAGPSSAVEGALRAAMSRIQAANADASEEEDSRVRHLEDPYLVGEEAAARARNERLARKYEDDILILEDRRWDRWLAQMRDVEERKRNWNTFRTNVDREMNNRRRLTRRFGR